MGWAQNPTDSARRHQDSYPIEAARRTICSTTRAVSAVSGTPGRTSCADVVELFTAALTRGVAGIGVVWLVGLVRSPRGSAEPAGQGGNVVVGDVKGPHPLGVGGAVNHHVAHPGGGGGGAGAYCPGRARAPRAAHG